MADKTGESKVIHLKAGGGIAAGEGLGQDSVKTERNLWEKAAPIVSEMFVRHIRFLKYLGAEMPGRGKDGGAWKFKSRDLAQRERKQQT
jgi:hypothetical protein